MPTDSPISAGFDDVDWTGVTASELEMLDFIGYDSSNERGQRFETQEEAARWAVSIGIDDFSFIVDYGVDGYGVYVAYEDFA